MELWIGHCFAYKDCGRVKDLDEVIRGFDSSLFAAIFGVESIFLNRHGGVANAKHAEMNKFAAKNSQYDKRFDCGTIASTPEQELTILFSMMEYLGFKYLA